MRLTFWGTRGSIPAPGPGTVKVGGNTTCLEVATDNGAKIIVDAGTGIRALGLALVKEPNPAPVTLLLTHSHWDHLAGFTFFAPAYHPAHQISVYGNYMAMEVLRRDIFERHDNRYFPVNMDNFRASIEWHDEMPLVLRVGDVTVECLTLNHPGNGYAYRFMHNGKSAAFITDNELGMEYPGGNTSEQITAFCRGTRVLIHDAQYLTAEIESHRGWGHSTYAEVAELAQRAGVPEILLTHHDPERDDAGCELLLEEARKYIRDHGYQVQPHLAVEGLTLEI
jgi:phosphoribosyl 1,2-cyclic phosphodiesterase